jgi:hypothetical protein
MRTGSLLFSAVHFFVVVGVLAVGGFFLGMAYFPPLRLAVLHLFSTNSQLFFLMGWSALFLGLLLLIGFYAMHRHTYYRVAMSSRVELPLIRELIDRHWKMLFSEEGKVREVILYPNQKIEVIAELPNVPLSAQEDVLGKIEKELGTLLANHLGYEREFLLTVLTK